jgi:hypothetical protein
MNSRRSPVLTGIDKGVTAVEETRQRHILVRIKAEGYALVKGHTLPGWNGTTVSPTERRLY